MAGLDRAAILGAKDIKIEPLVIPEWDGATVYIKALSAAERSRLEADIIKFAPDGRPMAYKLDRISVMVASLSLCDENGARLFNSSEEDLAALGSKSAAAINRIAEKANELAGITKQDVQTLLDGLKKTQPDASPSD